MRSALRIVLRLRTPAVMLVLLLCAACGGFDPLHPYDLPPPPDTSVSWQKTIGGDGEDDARSVLQASDGGFVFAGFTSSEGAGGFDAWLVKTDGSGSVAWSRTFGGAADDRAYGVIQTPDGGYLLVGSTESLGAGSSDLYLVKTDAEGNKEWEGAYGAADDQSGRCVTCSADGGYVAAGDTDGNGVDAFIVKTDADGNEIWQQHHGGARQEAARGIRRVGTGGYALCGLTENPTTWNANFYLLKIDEDGNEEWSRSFGGDFEDNCRAMELTADGGYLICGDTRSYGPGDFNAYLIRTDSSGNELSSFAFGTDGWELLNSARAASNGGWILAGMQRGLGFNQAWLVRTDSAGSILWEKRFGGDGDEWARSVDVTSDGGFILAGTTTSTLGGTNIDAYLVYYKP